MCMRVLFLSFISLIISPPLSNLPTPCRITPANHPCRTLIESSETINGNPLTKIINETHQNPKYLPGITLPSNITAIPDLITACRDATLLVFVTPHQFVHSICQALKASSLPRNCKAISLIKGVDVHEKGMKLMSQIISHDLGITCAVLSGANIASEIALEQFSESTIGTSHHPLLSTDL